ncbi:MAG: hypothetical protein AMJ53_18660 [Gammaproteobacteria bacterium SG8_11]|nr:MAG: hypothetical protein AMJ53_18660 [Gammaproteobacteria bacterium SG8_11]
MEHRVIFCGGKNIGCGVLEALIAEPNTDVVAVFVNPDSDVAKDRWHESATEIAYQHMIPVYAPHSINSPASRQLLKELAPDYIVVTFYDQILAPAIIDIPTAGAINLHMALTQDYRGCYSTTWALIAGAPETGVTLHWIDEGIDSGDIIAQVKHEIEPDDTGRSLYLTLTQLGIDLFRREWPRVLSGTAERTPQHTLGRYFKREFPSHDVTAHMGRRNWDNWVRALTFYPFPRPYFQLGERIFEIVEVDLD